MEDLVKTAKLYFNKCSPEVKKAAQIFFESLDDNNDGKVSLHEFLWFMQQEGHTKMSNRYFFNELDKDGSGTLEFKEVMALYYIIKSGRPFCGGCDVFLPGMYFTCSECFENGDNSFCLCPTCFEDESYVHDREHAQFLDNYALLEAKRTQRDQHKPSSSVAITQEPTSTTNAVVFYERPKREWAHHAYQMLNLALNAAFWAECTIM